jgi:hypothetical protein
VLVCNAWGVAASDDIMVSTFIHSFCLTDIHGVQAMVVLVQVLRYKNSSSGAVGVVLTGFFVIVRIVF